MWIVSQILVGFVAVAHLGFLCLEMFLWNTPKGHEIFKLTPEFAQASQTLAANQGLYNGFLAAGLIWSLMAPDEFRFPLQLFFLSCVFVAGIYGAATVSRTILYVQALPSFAALICVWIARGV